MIKTKTISPELIAEISVYSCVLPILVFLLFKHNWREKLKWFCLTLILVNFSFDLISDYYSKKPVSQGSVVGSKFIGKQKQVILKIEKGKVFERQFFRSGDFIGIISKKYDSIRDTLIIEVASSSATIESNKIFKTYSTLKIANFLLILELSLIFYIFYIIFRSHRLLRRLTITAIGLSILLWIYRNIILDQIHSYGGLYNAGTTLLVIFFSLVFFYHLLNIPEKLFVYSLPSFWIVASLLLFKAGTFFLFLFANTLDLQDLANFYLFDSIFYILQNTLFAISCLLPENPKKNSKN